MKSPAELIAKLVRQWHNADYREARLLDAACWPLQFTIGKPAANDLVRSLDRVRIHINQWRQIDIGHVHWSPVKFKSARDLIEVPVAWELQKPSQWIAATRSADIHREFQRLESLVAGAEPLFHRFLIRHLHTWCDKSKDDVLLALSLAIQLEPGCAQGAPLRALALGGADTKFFERNRSLIIKLLDIRFDGLVSEQGLEFFLGAVNNNDHWLLVADLDGGLLPFRQLRVRDTELTYTALPGTHLLIIENEHCHHQLPNVPGTIAILGAGLNLAWMKASWLAQKKLAYWGDLDTWGLSMLARARLYQPLLTPLLTTRKIFDNLAPNKAVVESTPAGKTPPQGLSDAEQALFCYLLEQQKGRLEQEFIGQDEVKQALTSWIENYI